MRFRQYLAYPLQLCASLALQRIRFASFRLFSFLFLRPREGQLATSQQETGKPKTNQPLLSDVNVCVVCTNTFYVPFLATFLHPNVIHLVYDLFPEAMIHSGKWREGSLKVRVVRWITRRTLRRVRTNVFLGQRLKDYVESIHGPVLNNTIIAVGADQSLFGRSPKERLGAKGGKVQKCKLW